MSAEYLFLFVTSAGVVLLASFCFLYSLTGRKLPPLAKEGTLKTVSTLSAGKANPMFFLAKMKELGVIYRISMPDFVAHWVIVCDAALSRKLLTEEDEKPFFIQRFSGLTNGTQTILTQRTNTHKWHTARKGVSASFSTTNVNLSLPWIYAMTDELKKTLIAHQTAGTTIDAPKLMTHLTLDLLCAGT